MIKNTVTVEEMLEKYCPDCEHVKEVLNYSLKIFDAINQKLCLLTSRDKEYLSAAAYLHDIGYAVEKKSHHKHTMELILENTLDGFDERETLIIANVARYHRHSFPDSNIHPYYAQLEENDRAKVNVLGGILRLADGLDKPHKNLILGIRIENVKDEIIFYIKSIGFKPNLKGAENKKDLFEHAFNKKVIFKFN